LLGVVSVQAGILDTIEGGTEDLAYALIKAAMITYGESVDYAECIVDMLKKSGTTQDVMELKNLFPPQRMMEKLKEKYQFSEMICRLGRGLYFIIGFAVFGIVSILGGLLFKFVPAIHTNVRSYFA